MMSIMFLFIRFGISLRISTVSTNIGTNGQFICGETGHNFDACLSVMQDDLKGTYIQLAVLSNIFQMVSNVIFQVNQI